jgi:hypothetical protein
MSSPYDNLPDSAYWRSGVAARSPLDPGGLYTPRFRLDADARIMTAGSCFAQHVGRTLRTAGYNVLDAEALPEAIPDAVAHRFGYGLYSARYGNIYTARQLLQLLREVESGATPPDSVWEKTGRFYDAFRPSVEPKGHSSPDAVAEHRAAHLLAIRKLLETLDVFVFTFGLTEAWLNTQHGTVYPTAPGTIAGRYDPSLYHFHNFGFAETKADFLAARDIIRRHNPKARFIITVSPVPLTATATGQHVEVATCYSKAVLRAVCGELYAEYNDIDYFPSYEVITSQTARGAYYEPNQRSVSATGVATAMGLFMAAQGKKSPGAKKATRPTLAKTRSAAAKRASPNQSDEDIVCEDALLEAFAR